MRFSRLASRIMEAILRVEVDAADTDPASRSADIPPGRNNAPHQCLGLGDAAPPVA
jgi:hypothetical protein